MQLNVFNGGQSSRLADYLIQPSEAVSLVNVDVSTGALEPVNTLASSPAAAVSAYPYYFEAESQWVSSSTQREYVEYQDKLYYTQAGAAPKVYYGGTEYQIGLTPPASAVSGTPTSAPEPPTNMRVAATPFGYVLANTTGGNLPDATALEYNYVVEDGSGNEVHSWLAFHETATTGGTNTVNAYVTAIPDGYTIKLYRKYSGAYHLVGTFSGISTPIVDSAYDISAAATTSYTGFGAILAYYTYQYQAIAIDGSGRQSEDITASVTTGNSLYGYFITIDVEAAGTVKIYRFFGNYHREVATTDAIYDISSSTEKPEYYALDGFYFYATTFYSTSTGLESEPSPLNADPGFQVYQGKVDLSGIQVSSDSRVDKVKIYRTGGTSAEFQLVAEINNGTTTYEDTTAERDLGVEILASEDYDTPPSGLRYLTQAYEIMFGAVEDKLYFSEVGLPQYWPAANFIDFDQPITGIGEAANGVLVFTKYKTFIVTGTSPSTLVKYLVSGDQGCVDNRSLVQYKGSVIWASTDGLCLSDGGVPLVVTKSFLGKLVLAPRQAVVYDEVYYLHQQSGNILAFDLRYGASKFYYLNVGTESLVKAQDTLYGYVDGSLYAMFGGADKASFSYTSPRFVGSGYSNTKAYKDFYMRSEGAISISIFIDNELIFNKSFTRTGTHDIIIPQNLQRGYSIQFTIAGTGSVKELEWKELERQNGR